MSERANRRPDWRARLTNHLEEWEGRPFAYGTADCWLFSMGAAGVQMGVDYIGAARGYDSRETGLAAIQAATGRKSHVDFVYRTFGKLDTIWKSMPGDIVTLQTHDGLGLGVVQGSSIYAMTETNGLLLVPLETAHGVYSVGQRDRS